MSGDSWGMSWVGGGSNDVSKRTHRRIKPTTVTRVSEMDNDEQLIIRPKMRRDWLGFLGFRGKTVWDLMGLLTVPLVIALAGWWLSEVSTRNQQQIEDDRVRQTVLQSYIQDMTELLLDKGLATSEPDQQSGTSLDQVHSPQYVNWIPTVKEYCCNSCMNRTSLGCRLEISQVSRLIQSSNCGLPTWKVPTCPFPTWKVPPTRKVLT